LFSLKFLQLAQIFWLLSIINAALHETHFHHEEREGHEDRTKKRTSNPKKKVFFLRALRVLRGDIHFSFLVVALSTLCPSCQICGRPDSLSYPRSSVVPAVAALGHKKA
jgi:hypothetical protein